eukprot:scaffold259046_cov33-Tisochrysis_lutea.AAC.3
MPLSSWINELNELPAKNYTSALYMIFVFLVEYDSMVDGERKSSLKSHPLTTWVAIEICLVHDDAPGVLHQAPNLPAKDLHPRSVKFPGKTENVPFAKEQSFVHLPKLVW